MSLRALMILRACQLLIYNQEKEKHWKKENVKQLKNEKCIILKANSTLQIRN